MDLSKQKKSYLLDLCKTHNIKGYSKLKKDDIITRLVAAGVKNTSDIDVVEEIGEVSIATEKPKSPSKPRESKPRIEKLNKKLEKFIAADDYKEQLGKFTEDVSNELVLELVKTNTTEFITSNTLTDDDFKRYVDDYGVMKAIVEFLEKNPKANLHKMTSEQIYKQVATFLFNNDDSVYDNLVKKFKKFTLSLIKTDKAAKELKPIKEKKAAKSKKTIAKNDSDDEPEPESDQESEIDELEDEEELEEED